jgi:hypothetical protein
MFHIYWNEEFLVWKALFLPDEVWAEADTPKEALENLIFELKRQKIVWEQPK